MHKKLSWNHFLLLFALPQMALKAIWSPEKDWFILMLIVQLAILLYLFALLIAGIQRTFKRDFKSILQLVGVVIIVFLLPINFLFGYTRFIFNHGFRQKVVAELNAGKYDSAILVAQGGAYIKLNGNVAKVYRRGSLRMVYIEFDGWEGPDSEYYGVEYIAGEHNLEQYDVAYFLRPAKRVYLGNNWYWVHDYPDYTPGP